MIKSISVFLLVFAAFFAGFILIRNLPKDQYELLKRIIAYSLLCAFLTISALMTIVFLF